MLAGRDDTPVLTLTLRATDTVGLLRSKVANHFKESPDVISLTKLAGRTGTGAGPSMLLGLGGSMMGERLDRDDSTLRQVKFSPIDAVIARKREPIPPPPPPPGTAVAIPIGQAVARGLGLGTGSGGGGQGTGGKAMKSSGPLVDDLITPPDLADDLLALLQPLHWLGTTVCDYESTTTSSSAFAAASTSPTPTGGLALVPASSNGSDVSSVRVYSVSSSTPLLYLPYHPLLIPLTIQYSS